MLRTVVVAISRAAPPKFARDALALSFTASQPPIRRSTMSGYPNMKNVPKKTLRRKMTMVVTTTIPAISQGPSMAARSLYGRPSHTRIRFIDSSIRIRFTGIAMAMHLDNNWVVPQLFREPFLEKPPLSLWIDAGAIRLFGGTTFTTNLYD